MSAYTNSGMQGPTSHSLTLWRCQHTPTAMRATCQAPPPIHSLSGDVSIHQQWHARTHLPLTLWRCQHTPSLALPDSTRKYSERESGDTSIQNQFFWNVSGRGHVNHYSSCGRDKVPERAAVDAAKELGLTAEGSSTGSDMRNCILARMHSFSTISKV